VCEIQLNICITDNYPFIPMWKVVVV